MTINNLPSSESISTRDRLTEFFARLSSVFGKKVTQLTTPEDLTVKTMTLGETSNADKLNNITGYGDNIASPEAIGDISHSSNLAFATGVELDNIPTVTPSIERKNVTNNGVRGLGKNIAPAEQILNSPTTPTTIKTGATTGIKVA